MIHLRFLGTGTSHGVPMIGCDCDICTSDDPRDSRSRSSVMIRSGETTIVIDCGPDFRQQILAAGHNSIDALLITHEHSDHVAGLDDLRAVNYKMKRDIPIYLDRRSADSIKSRFHYAFEVTHSGVPKFELNIISPDDIITVGDLKIEVLRVLHGRLPILGFKIGDLVYLTDVKTLPEETIEKISGCKVLIISSLRVKPHPSHLSLNESLNLIQVINPDRAYISHISHRLYSFNDLQQILPEGVFSAFDGLQIDI